MTDRPPLSARSVVLSLVLGAHPRPVTAAQLRRAGEHLTIAATTVRVALSRAVSAGDLRRTADGYHLGDRLLARQRRQEVAVQPWDGTWETAVVVGPGRPSTDRAALRAALTAARLAELREGVWLRPANLVRALPELPVRTFTARPTDDAAGLAAALWDLGAWSAEAGRTLDELATTTTGPAERLAVAAHLVRHLATDPLLPPPLQPAGWPAGRARAVYADYRRELGALGIG